MRLMAGFPANDLFFCLECAALDPPTTLCKRLFPAFDEWHDRQAAKEISPDNNDPIQPNAAAVAFIQYR
jgi:hypothetical protein